MKYSCRISVSFKLFFRYLTESCIGSLREIRQASPSFMAWLRETRHDSIRGSTYFSANHFRRIASDPCFEKLITNLRSLVPDTSPSGGTSTSAPSARSYLYRI